MNGIMYKLSIIIPTYNGGGWIEDTLNSILPQLVDVLDKVELFVRDNASLDNTPSIINRLNGEYGNIIHYDRRETNTDADTNFREAVMLTSSEYVLLLGDDDLLFPNYIRYTLDILNSYHNIGLIYFNRISTTRDYKGAALKHTNPCPDFKMIYDSVEEFIKEHPSGPDFMSVNVVKRDCLLKGIPHSKKEYYGVEWYYSMLHGLNGYKCISLFSPMILQRVPTNRMWSDKSLLYVGVGMDNLFKDISLLYPSAYETWKKYRSKNIPMMFYILESIPNNRELYKNKWQELSGKLFGKEKLVAFILLKIPCLTVPTKFVVSLFIKSKGFLKLLSAKLFK